uniref:Uncharacterized protein n=1 Tax=Glossina austeni TaxID=7395 RepID=A0A1A9UZG1_GLOAU
MAVQNQRLMKSSLADNTVTPSTTTTTTTTQTTATRNSNSATVPSMTMPPSSSTSSLPAKTLQATHTSAPTPTASPQIATHATINGGPRVSFNRDVHVKRIDVGLTLFESKDFLRNVMTVRVASIAISNSGVLFYFPDKLSIRKMRIVGNLGSSATMTCLDKSAELQMDRWKHPNLSEIFDCFSIICLPHFKIKRSSNRFYFTFRLDHHVIKCGKIEHLYPGLYHGWRLLKEPSDSLIIRINCFSNTKAANNLSLVQLMLNDDVIAREWEAATKNFKDKKSPIRTTTTAATNARRQARYDDSIIALHDKAYDREIFSFQIKAAVNQCFLKCCLELAAAVAATIASCSGQRD